MSPRTKVTRYKVKLQKSGTITDPKLPQLMSRNKLQDILFESECKERDRTQIELIDWAVT